MPEPQLTFDVLFDEDAHGAVVAQPVWRPSRSEAEGEQLTGLWDDGDGKAWWLFDAAGSRTLLARPEDFGVTDVGDVVELRWSEDGRILLVVLDGRFRLFDAERRRLMELGGESEIRGQDPRQAPGGRRLAFVRDNDLYVLDLATAEATRLSDDGRPEVVFNGATDWVYWEEIWGRAAAGHWWSGDGRRLAYYHFDDSDVPVYPLVDTRPLYPELERQRYPKAGDTLPQVEVRVVDVESGRTVRLNTDGDVYLTRVDWHPDGEHVAVERLHREQTRLDLLLCGVDDGSCRILATQEWPTWVDLGGIFHFLSDGRFLWSTEDTGWRHLYLYTADGRSRQRLTPEDWALASLEAVDEEGGRFLFTAYSTAPLGAAERHVFEGSLASESVRRLTEGPSWHAAAPSPGGLWLDAWSDASTPTRQRLRDPGGGVALELPRREPSYEISRLPQWEHLLIPGPNGVELPAQLMKPGGFDPSRKYPVVMHHYGCPSSQVVDYRWHVGQLRFLWERMMAERGYGIFFVENEASLFFGKRGQDKVYRRFGEVELAGQLAGVAYLESLPWVDASRLGLWGWSGGGANTLYSLLRSPGVWKAGVAGAPVTDWRYYDAIWMERYLGRPQDNEEGYRLSAPLTYAAELRDALLLVHGTADDNVHPQNTLNLVDAFIEAGVQFDLALYPNARHSLTSFSRQAQRHFFERMTAFFDRHLRP